MEGHVLFGVVLLVTLGLSYGEVIKTQKCYLPAAYQKSCAVHEVRIDPCPEAAENKPCKIKLGGNASLTFDYTAAFSSETLGSQAYKVNALVDVPFEQMATDGCRYTTCPVEANKKQLYNYTIEISKQFPADTHQLKWKLWNGPNHQEQCCFKFTIELVN